MQGKITSIFMASTILFATSCASIVSKSNYPISINSTPSEARIIITDKKGVEVYQGNTPATLQLKAGNGFFSKAKYKVKFEKDGYDVKTVAVQFKLDGWYFGNILFGGIIGFLIVDPATGAMYKLDTKFLDETLTQSTTSIQKEELKLYTIDEIPVEWKKHLIVVAE
ncbi:peptidase associated/transthyretin-like domain-containing protein [Aquimarina sediminis]|uniref:hypothetical protein n=1 Tax=Aquimarina sediminis TaxID=2070536 RepID=UPI000CA041EC|nr:hypothetical protein [Aquimarina sediminis]